MTEASEDGDYLVRVRAQVMVRDDSTGGWVPMGGGGLSSVSVRKRTVLSAPQDTKHEYLIFGQRISDQAIILSCVIKKDFEYNKVMPTFHHWKSGDKKFGLTFQTAADARAFDKGVKTAVEELLDGLYLQYGHLPPPTTLEDVGDDDDVFMTLDLPVEREDSRSSSDSSAGKTPPSIIPPPAQPPPPPIPEVETTGTTGPEYIYPVIEESKGGVGGGAITSGRRDSTGSLKRRSPLGSRSLGGGVGFGSGKGGNNGGNGGNGGRKKERCRHCQEPFYVENNKRGSCEYAPDCTKTSINAVACISCAQCMLYHCMSDPEGDFVQHPCECGPASDEQCTKRWVGLALLSLVVPCLWCYPPLRACHWCCISCGICGGKHTPASS
ncbi:Sprouty protein (Spry) [Nesidiocoris tenuis]|uniref:Sprouty protein (Spry) n=1 Tax=Nesidiocoris tenuis TaxID=355587 RepID=A0ABN7ADR6_9HEMI|nr:Sprouty protein (Spry) [Nesidiocoris tenuis]